MPLLHDQAHAAKRQAGLTRLWRDGKGCDITIRALTRLEDGAATTGASVAAIEIEAHRVVLAEASDPLYQMIFGDMACVDEENVLTLADGIEPAALQSVLEYVYSGTLELTQDTMWAVLKACMYLELSGAIRLCTEFLSAQLTPANVIGVVKAAGDLYCAELKAAALAFTKAHMAAVSEGAVWLQMPEEEAWSLVRGTHSLSAVGQLVVFEALGRWVEHLPNERRGAFVQCMASEDDLGLCYAFGWGVAQDFIKAAEWYTKAADQGFPHGQTNLGRCYLDGEGVTQDLGKAVELFTKAAEQGFSMGQLNLGFCYNEGKGVAQDRGKAVDCYQKAAEQGDAHGQYYLACSYERGEGVAQDLGKAMELLTKAAEQGHAIGQHHLGYCYDRGKSVAQDSGKAVEWFTKAAAQGLAEGQCDLGICYENGDGVAKDLGVAVKWYAMAAEQGDSLGQFNLGRCYEQGKGVARDLGEAVEWYTKAAEQGHSDARAMLERIELFCQEHPDHAHLFGR